MWKNMNRVRISPTAPQDFWFMHCGDRPAPPPALASCNSVTAVGAEAVRMSLPATIALCTESPAGILTQEMENMSAYNAAPCPPYHHRE